jgi:hypothetical protein
MLRRGLLENSSIMRSRGLLEINSTMRSRGLLACNKIVIQIKITKIRTVMKKMMIDTTTTREATTREAMTIEETQTQTTEAEAVLLNNITKTPKNMSQNTT